MLRPRKLQKILVAILLALIYIAPFHTHATIHPVSNGGPNAIKTFIEDTDLWNPGDTILLSESSIYILTSTVDIPQTITIMGDPELSSMPIVHFYDNGFRPSKDQIDIILKGFYAIGIEPQDSMTQSRAKSLLRFDHAEWSEFGNIVIEDMRIESFRQIIEFYRNQFGSYESFTLHNCLVHDIAGETALDFRKASVEEITITQNSFSDIEHGFFGELYFQDDNNLSDQERYVEQNVLIDHNTFYHVVGGFNRSLIQNNAGIDGSVSLTFSNNVVSTLFHPEDARPFRINPLAGDFILKNNVFHNFESPYNGGSSNLDVVAQLENVTVVETAYLDPVFYDITGNGAYNFIAAHPAFASMSTSGGLIGDLRWLTGPQNTLHKIANTGDDVLSDFIENTDLWTPGDTILLGEASVYVEAEGIDIAQEVVIMGDYSLPELPVIRFDGDGFLLTSDSINFTLKGFRASGVEPGDTPTVAASVVQSMIPEGSFSYAIVLEGLDIENFGQLVQLNRHHYQSLSIHDCYARNLSNDYAIAANLSSIAEISVTNSTFTDIPNGFLSGLYFQDETMVGQEELINQEVVIDRNTFYRVGGSSDNSFISSTGTDGSINFAFSNNIVSQLYDAETAKPFLIDAQAGDFLFQNSAFHEFTSTVQSGDFNLDVIATQPNVTISNINTEDPAFLSTELDYNFTISNLIYLNASTNNNWIGDPRWVPQAASTVHWIFDNGNNGLEAFIEDITLWTPGDTIMLAESVTYEIQNTIDIKQGVVILANPNLEEKPVLRFLENGFRQAIEDVSIYMEGFAAEGTAEPGTSFYRFEQTESFKNITLQSLDFKDLGAVISLYEDQYGHYETLTIDDCTAENLTGPMAIATNRASVQNLSITNSTFINIQQGFLDQLYFQDDTNTPDQEDLIAQEIFIDHNTFFKVTGRNESSFIDHPDGNDSSVDFTFSNNIVANLYHEDGAVPFTINEAAGDYLFTNSLFHAFESGGNTLSALSDQSNVTVQSIDTNYPRFKDSTIYDLRLWEYEPVRTAGTDGKEIGDPRWVPEVYPVSASTIHRIPNTQMDTLRSIIENTVIWDPGDTILLVSEGEYIETASIKINQSLVIMADTSLTSKPVIRFYDNGFQVATDSLNIHISGVNFNGLSDSGSEKSPFIIRYYTQAGTYHTNLVIENSEATDFRGAIDLEVGKHGIYENIELNNVIFQDFDGEYCIDPNLNFIKNMKVTNSTFYNITYGFLKNPGFSNEENDNKMVEQHILIDHNTFYKVGGNNNSFMQINDPNDNSIDLTFSNNIVSTLFQKNNARPFRINGSAGNLIFQNSVIHNMDASGSGFNFDDALALTNVTSDSLIYEDPEYTDPNNGDFTLSNVSALLTYGSDGKAIGDPRWAPEPGEVSPTLSNNEPHEVVLYPNPATDYLYFTTQQMIQINVRDINGRMVIQKRKMKDQRLSIQHLQPGIYMVEVLSDEGHFLKRIVKQ